MEREIPLDIAKGIGIILVVLGHTLAGWGTSHQVLHRFIYSFHMPLFFGISCAYISQNSPFITFVKSKLTRFVLPFFFWVLFYFVLSRSINIAKLLIASLRHANDLPPLTFEKDLVLLPLLANWSSLDHSALYVDLWFLPAIFSTVILYRLLGRWIASGGFVLNGTITIIVSFAVAHFNELYQFHPHVPWSLDIAIVCFPFIHIVAYRHYWYKLNIFFVPLLLLVIYLLCQHMHSFLAQLDFNNYWQFLATGLAGTILVLLVSSLLKTTRLGTLCSKIGRRSYLIFVLQGAIYTLWRPIASRLSCFANDDVQNVTLLILGLTATYMSYPWITRSKYLRFLALGESPVPKHIPPSSLCVTPQLVKR